MYTQFMDNTIFQQFLSFTYTMRFVFHKRNRVISLQKELVFNSMSVCTPNVSIRNSKRTWAPYQKGLVMVTSIYWLLLSMN